MLTPQGEAAGSYNKTRVFESRGFSVTSRTPGGEVACLNNGCYTAFFFFFFLSSFCLGVVASPVPLLASGWLICLTGI